MLCNDKPHIVIVTESWLNSSVSDACIVGGLPYSVLRADRLNREGGGVCLLVSSSLNAIVIPLPSCFCHLELLIVDIYICNNLKIRLFSAYRQPSSSRDLSALSYISDMCRCIEQFCPNNATVILTGDFNYPDIDWSDANNCIRCNLHTCAGIFLSLVYKLGLEQFVLSPTRAGAILDLIFSNDFNCINNVDVTDPLGTSDHNRVLFQISYTPPNNVNNDNVCSSKYYFDFKHADWDGVRLFLSNVDFYSLFYSSEDINSICDNFYQVLYNTIEHFVPVRLLSNRSKSGPRYPLSIRKLHSRKLTAWRKYRNTRTQFARSHYNKIAARCRLEIRNFIKERESSLLQLGNIGSFYRYANNKFCSKSSIGPITDSCNNLTFDSFEKCEIFQRTFSSHFTVDNKVLPPPPCRPRSDATLSTIVFTSSSVRRSIQRLRVNSKGGPDGIPPMYYKQCMNELCEPLSILYNLCLQNSHLPSIWNKAYISPIYKKGDRTDANNYRPIALTCTMCKLMESTIKDQLVDYLNSNNLISRHQHAFLSNHSTLTNLLECTHDWQVSLNCHRSTDIAYVDLSRAFDSIVFEKLLFKLSFYGVSGSLLTWIKNFLYNRQQCVVMNNNFSLPTDVKSGVPQGSVLGPILFIVFINDIEAVCSGSCITKLFADDCKLYSDISLNGSICLQQSLNNLCNYADVNQLSINILKCFILSILPRSCSLTSPCSYFINNVSLRSQSDANDLGISMSHDLSFKTHISNIVAKAYCRQSVLFRGFATRDLSFMRKAFITYIRPLLEYNSSIWNPSEIYLIDLIENIQREFSRRIPSLSDLSYRDRLEKLNLEPLELRRLRYDLGLYFKVLNNLTPLNPSDFFLIYHSPPSSRSASTYLTKPVRASSKFLSSFFFRHVDIWNRLPTSITCADSFACFKNQIHSFDLRQFLKCSALK